MSTNLTVVTLAETSPADRAVIGGKAAVLAELSVAGFPVPPGFVVTTAALDDPQLDRRLATVAGGLVGDRFAVRSSGAAEDLPDASYAGLYETYLNVPTDELGEAVRRCFAAATSERVAAYHQRQGGATAAMAVLVQVMVDPAAAGVAFTAHPVTGHRDQTVVAAVAGLGEPLVSGETTGEEWTITAGRTLMTRSAAGGGRVLDDAQAAAVADLSRRIADRYDGQPQDVEWAIDQAGKLWLLQARPMTAVPEPVSWTPPGPGLWMRNFRLGEWLPEAVTPLFATWLLPLLEGGYLDGMKDSVGVRVPFRYALVNGWYFNATPIPSPKLLAQVLWHGRTRAVKILFNALIRVSYDPYAADRAALAELERGWREQQLPNYRRLVASAQGEVETASPRRLAELVDALGREAGISLWYLAIVGGSAWKMEARLTRFARRHLVDVLPEQEGGAQVLLRGLPGAQLVPGGHAVQSVDWYHPVAADLPISQPHRPADRHRELAERRMVAEHRCRAALDDRPRLVADFDRLVKVNQRYAMIREEQASQFTLAWPILRACARRLGQYLVNLGAIEQPDDIYYCTRDEVITAITDSPGQLNGKAAERRTVWQRQRRLAAPLTLGRPARLIGDVIERAVEHARGTTKAEGAVTGHPASAGRASGAVAIVHGPEDFDAFTEGQVLVAKATAPAWTPLFARAAAVVTDGGTLAAHASLVAREYGIPAVVGTGNATQRLRPGQLVTVDGTAGTVTPQG
ncbi:PEP/pyruvate-binding domain-containing protein [Micromonospora soli]|uniref:PEP/pyruvate-binding domain-containing protein n=1 Tax=Micromonospora sp. NBRC 110009 TaxID=3061627 RepID=UPI0026736E10|nr:PEP/pyruvate-binding domain-containing protein [Micromonospora sp. NBRC 110009]WKT98695.1 PEP/pyruvate-binding domain-containing protein [Micromonospora sp. NBRC 110009]